MQHQHATKYFDHWQFGQFLLIGSNEPLTVVPEVAIMQNGIHSI